MRDADRYASNLRKQTHLAQRTVELALSEEDFDI